MPLLSSTFLAGKRTGFILLSCHGSCIRAVSRQSRVLLFIPNDAGMRTHYIKEAVSSATPGPMVELTETAFM